MHVSSLLPLTHTRPCGGGTPLSATDYIARPNAGGWRGQLRPRSPPSALQRGATLVAPATGVILAGGPDVPRPPPIAALHLSPFVAGQAAPRCNSCMLQPLEKTTRNKNPVSWHRFCLLMKGREARGLGTWSHMTRAP